MREKYYDTKKLMSTIEAKVELQRALGGRLVMYKRRWSALFISGMYDVVEHVPCERSRLKAGGSHSLFTLLLGLWSLQGLIVAPYCVFVNMCGGVDVTARYSDSPIDSRLGIMPDPAQEKRDSRFADWLFIVLLLLSVTIFSLVYLRMSK